MDLSTLFSSPFLVLIFICIFVIYRWIKSPYRHMPFGIRKLPGPWSIPSSFPEATLYINRYAGIPLIGRIHDVPPERTWLQFYKWSKEFGPIFKHELFGTTHVWISSEKIAQDLLAKQSATFSDRPLINNLPINKTGGEYLPLLGKNGMSIFQSPDLRYTDNFPRNMAPPAQIRPPPHDSQHKTVPASIPSNRDQTSLV